MTLRTRKFIGAIMLPIYLVIYSILAMAFGASQIVGESTFVQVIYFFAAGIIWVIPAGLLIRWMQRPDPSGT
jgi:hypothetical protein